MKGHADKAGSNSSLGFLARVTENGRCQQLEDHLKGVSALAAEFAGVFECPGWAGLAGLWHDIGKYSEAFQNYLRISTETRGLAGGAPRKVDHSTLGAQTACERLGGLGRILAYVIAGHHAGLPDWQSERSGMAGLAQRLDKRTPPAHIPNELLSATIPAEKPRPGSDPSMWVRMLFSCLVDADCLDSEAFGDPRKANLRRGYPELKDLLPLFNTYMLRKSELAPKSRVNQARAEILKQCTDKSEAPPGIFTLTVPTGGGKTLSSMAFALNHASRYHKRRIIYVIPYTSIIEQTADQFREVFGEAVLEHHSNIEPPEIEEDRHSRSRLATENWDAPIIVTTSVQFFESLYAARPGRCRKLHNIVDSIVILDEVQLLPPRLLKPILRSLVELTKNYGVTLLLSTATQPAFKPVRAPDFRFDGLPDTTEVIADPVSLYNRFRRTRVHVPEDTNARRSWHGIAEELHSHPTVLCIVNRRDDCRKLHGLMPAGTVHLSALMCGAHRSRVIAELKERLRQKTPTRVISTQLVEAGVDLDFPVVYRALAGLDSVAQAAGRCNREGLLDSGKVVVFVPESDPPMGLLRMAAGIGSRLLARAGDDPLAPERFEDYFKELYWLHGDRLDEYGILSDLAPDPELKFSFRTAARKFHIIDETSYAPVFVRYAGNAALLGRLAKEGPEKWLMRKLQRYIVNVPKYQLDKMVRSGEVEEAHPGAYIQTTLGAYDERVGLICDRKQLSPDDLVV